MVRMPAKGSGAIDHRRGMEGQAAPGLEVASRLSESGR
jgi:hypothetical protein